MFVFSSRFTLGVSRIFLAFAFVCSVSRPVSAYDVPEVGLADWKVPGDGKTPTFLQYLDSQGYDFKPANHLASATTKGDAVYSFSLDLPPAILKPSLSLSYSSESGLSLEMPYGWSLNGIVEIKRPLVRAYKNNRMEDREKTNKSEWLVSGADFSGTLMPSGESDYRFFLRTSSPKLVTAEYDWDNDRWKIYHDGVTYELSPKDEGQDTPDGTATWRVDKTYDTSGNYVSYSYDEDGRIEKISYGGNETTGEDHLITVAFAYGANAVTRTNARAGFVVEYESHIEKITIQEGDGEGGIGSVIDKASVITAGSGGILAGAVTTAPTSQTVEVSSGFKIDAGLVTGIISGTATDSDDEEDSKNRLYAYDLVYAVTDSLDLLIEIEREGETSRDVETVATFEYGEFDDSATPARTSTSLPDFLGATEGESQGSAGLDDHSYTTKILADFNRDGLPDVVDSSSASETNKVWRVRARTVDHASRGLSWDATINDVAAVGGPVQAITTEGAESTSEYYRTYSKNHTTRQLVDVDGDGYVDILESGSEDEWLVYYGTGSGFPAATSETPPKRWEYSQTAHAVKADKVTTGTYNSADIISGLIDINGDGWLDAFSQGGDVYFHSGTRGGGWETTLRDFGGALDEMRSVTYTIDSERFELDDGDFERFCENECQDSCNGCEDDGGCCEDEEDECDENDCTSECTDECVDGNESTRQKYISATDEWQAFYDINGDGLPDGVSSYSVPWKVYLNNGHGFESRRDWSAPTEYSRRSDEGRPTVHWESRDMDIDQSETGSPARVYQMLLDVDGDGLLDLAMGKSHPDSAYQDKWYKNTGAGFETSARDLPAWWPDDFMTSTSEADVNGDNGRSTSEGVITGMMIDLDHDGALDSLTTSSTSLKYGPYPKPYVLTKVENAQGGATEIAYRSLATVTPSGDFSKTQNTPIVKHLVDEIATEDALTGQSAETDFAYEDGYYEDGVFQGFGSRTVSQKINGTWTSDAEYDYELDRDFSPLVTARELYVDFNLGFAPSLKRGAATRSLRYKIANAYGDYGDTGDFFRLLKTRKTTEYGERGGSKSVLQTYAWGDYGNLTSYRHNGGGVSADAVTTTFEYVNDVSGNPHYDAKFYRMNKKVVSGTDPISGTSRVFFTEIYCYDNSCDEDEPVTKGLFTNSCLYGGWVDGGESLNDCYDIDYGRGDRGELVSIDDNETGITMTQTFGFGGAVLKTQTNALGQKLTRVIDEQGRVTSVKDDNGLTIESTYDAFNRVTKKTVTGSDGKTYTHTVNSYARTTSPFYAKTKLYDEDGTVETTAYALEDGFGNVAQNWAQDESGDYLVTNALKDLRGLPTSASHPENKGTSFSTSTALSVTTAFNKSYYDALGEARETVRDDDAGTGSQSVYHDVPWGEIRKDENGYQTRVTYDAHHRVIKVEQGKASVYVTTGSYRYDPLGRLVRFEDGKGTYYTYYYDGAGRLRAVYYNGKTKWYSYEYKGILKKSMTDNTGATATWESDALGRTTTLTISDPLPSSAGSLTYTYDYDDAWVGALYKTTDPSGSTEYEYDEFGRESRVKRTYAASSAGTQSPEFVYDYNLLGNLVSQTLPSGHTLTATHQYGRLITQSAATSGTTDYTLTYGYNKWGLINAVDSSLGHRFSQTFTTPLWVDKIKMKYGTTTYLREYAWMNNGLLSSRTEDVLTVSSGTSLLSGSLGGLSGSLSGILSPSSSSSATQYSYFYDNLKELVKINTPAKIIETYAYDAAGRPTAMQDSSGAKWTYVNGAALNQIASRASDRGGSDVYTYDAAGRVKTWTSGPKGTQTYYYDGLGRLRGVDVNGVWQMVLDYDADGNLLRRADNNPYTATPSYAYKFRVWRYDERTQIRTEADNGFVSAEQTGTGAVTRKWFLKDYDGHAALVFDDSGALQSSRTFGGYGSVVSSSGTMWDWNSFHGTEEQNDVFHMGQRHLLQLDGQWLQPEPLLYLGIPGDKVFDPLGLSTYRYARNTPTSYRDQTGFVPNSLIYNNTAFLAQNINVTVYGDYAPGTEWSAAANFNPELGKTNCHSVSIAADLRTAGIEASAGLADLSTREAISGFYSGEFGHEGKWVEAKSGDDIAKALSSEDDRAIVYGINKETGDGHFFNARNDGAGVVFEDYQTWGDTPSQANPGDYRNLSYFETTDVDYRTSESRESDTSWTDDDEKAFQERWE